MSKITDSKCDFCVEKTKNYRWHEKCNNYDGCNCECTLWVNNYNY